MIKLLTNEQSDAFYTKIDDKTKAKTKDARSFTMPLGNDKYLMSFHWVNGDKVLIYADPATCMVMTDNEEVRTMVKSIDKPEGGLEEMFFFFLNITADEVYRLEAIEAKIASIEDTLLLDMRPDPKDLSKIINIRKEIGVIKRYYIQMEFLSDDLADCNHYFAFIDKKFDRLLDYILRLSESIEQVREAYQSQIDIEQNNVMKFFTVVTTIFLPLTLITGWFGMNIIMPEFKWAYGYPYVIGLSIIVVLGLVAVFKKKKWF
jgi:Mg2+ and Co2+ transporters